MFVVASLTLVASCSSTDVAAPVSVATTEAAASSSIAEERELLVDVSEAMNRRGGIGLDSCKIEDITPNGFSSVETNTSGFLIPPQAVDLIGEVWLRIIPVETSDGLIEESRIESLHSTMRTVSDFFKEQSFGQAVLKWFVEEKSDWVKLAESNREIGIVEAKHSEDMSYLMEQILRIARPGSSRQDKQLVLVVLPSETTSQIEQTTRSVDGEPVNEIFLENGIILSSNMVVNWKSLAHSIGHSWLRIEDLYHHAYFGAPQDYFGMWDVMAFASAPIPEFSGWFRWRSGWLNDDQVRCDEIPSQLDRFISPLDSDSSSVKLSVFPTSNHSAVLVEVRTRLKQGENGLVGLVYSIDTSFEHGNGPIRLVGILDADGDVVEMNGQRFTRVTSDESGVVVRTESL